MIQLQLLHAQSESNKTGAGMVVSGGSSEEEEEEEDVLEQEQSEEEGERMTSSHQPGLWKRITSMRKTQSSHSIKSIESSSVRAKSSDREEGGGGGGSSLLFGGFR